MDYFHVEKQTPSSIRLLQVLASNWSTEVGTCNFEGQAVLFLAPFYQTNKNTNVIAIHSNYNLKGKNNFSGEKRIYTALSGFDKTKTVAKCVWQVTDAILQKYYHCIPNKLVTSSQRKAGT